MDEKLKAILKEALQNAYNWGRADGKYIPDEVLPGLLAYIKQAGYVRLADDQILYDALWKEKDRLEKETLSANSQLLSDIKLIETLTEKNERLKAELAKVGYRG